MKRIKTSIILVLLSISAIAQEKNNNNVVINPTNSVVVSVRDDKIRRQIIADWDDEINFPRAINNGINRQLLVSDSDRIMFEKENQSVGSFYISKEKLIELLYSDNTTQGFNLFFTKNNNEIVLVKANGKYNNIDNTFEYLNTTGNKPNLSSITSVRNSSLAQIRAGFKHSIKSYFIGRHCIMRNFTDNKGNFSNETAGVRMDIRENSTKQYSIIFTLVNKDKSTKHLGLATTEPESGRIRPLGGGASSRPCPTHCPEE